MSRKKKKKAKDKYSGPKKTKLTAKTANKHVLYEEAVQCVEADVDFFLKTYSEKRGGAPLTLKEDFCGTAALACDFIKRGPENRAWGVDLDRPTLDWGEQEHASKLGDAQSRLVLIEDNVLAVTKPQVQIVCALNFSFSVFKTRSELRAYFDKALKSLTKDGMFFVDCFGGSECLEAMEEDRKITPESRPDGTVFEPFTYVWEQAEFNPINHHMTNYIHFQFKDGTKLRKAFEYDWRFWTLPELQEIMIEAGFSEAEVFIEGWDDEEDEADGVFVKQTSMENIAGWVGYVVGTK